VKHPLKADVLVDIGPVHALAPADESEALALLGSGVGESPRPGESQLDFSECRYQFGNVGYLKGSTQRGGGSGQVRIISRRPLREFAEKHADAAEPLSAWFQIIKGRNYEDPHQLREDFPTASFLGRRRTVFNIGGNKYRLVVDMRYDLGRVYVRHILTHEEYDRRSIEGTL